MCIEKTQNNHYFIRHSFGFPSDFPHNTTATQNDTQKQIPNFNEGLWYQIVVTYDNNTQITKIHLKQEGKDMIVLHAKKIDQQPGIGTIRDRGEIRVRPQYFFIGYSGLLNTLFHIISL